MALLKTVEDKIKQIEGFKVAFTWGGVDVRGNKADIPQYTYSLRAPDSWTVSEWIAKSFNTKYPGYGVKVYTKNNVIASGNMKLTNIR